MWLTYPRIPKPMWLQLPSRLQSQKMWPAASVKTSVGKGWPAKGQASTIPCHSPRLVLTLSRLICTVLMAQRLLQIQLETLHNPYHHPTATAPVPAAAWKVRRGQSTDTTGASKTVVHSPQRPHPNESGVWVPLPLRRTPKHVQREC